jgi:cyclic beta-1,2-glucan synthetase
LKPNTIQELLSHLRISFPGDNLLKKYNNEKLPLRAELFSTDQMQGYGKTLAARHRVIEGRAPNKLLKRLADNEELLIEVHNLLTEAVKENTRIIPAGEWLLDNFYLIQEQIRTGKKHLPKGYSEDLPRLVNGASEGLPRVYDIAIELISHTDGRVDVNGLGNFISVYQSVSKLKLGELWALPIMLRLALIENLRRLAAQIAKDRIHRNLAAYWSEQMIETAEQDPKSLILVIADMARSSPPMVSSFVAELTRRLQGKGPALALPLTWIEQRLSETGQNSNDLVQAEIQKQAADQVSMSNSISSLRFLGTNDWGDFVENTSDVERTLREDFQGTYAKMDFTTRDRYRHIVEKMAKKSKFSELEIAQLAIQLARDNGVDEEKDKRFTHVGYFLIGKGNIQLEKVAKIHLSFPEVLRRIIYRSPLVFYAGSIVLLSLIIAYGLFAKAYGEGLKSWVMIVVGFLSLLCTGQLAVSLVNWLSTLVVSPRLLPRMDFSKGIPEQFRTLIVIPTMLSSLEEIESLVEALEVRFLANRYTHLHFGLLTDFQDSQQETLPEDIQLLGFATQKIEELNLKYREVRDDIFYLFHRPRKWNATDKIWMGYERKRGKLTQLNELLRKGAKEHFSLILGDQEILPQVKYVITLDSDTKLPLDAAWKIVATLAHPLNQPVYNEKKQRVTEGYGILQPRVTMSLPGPNSSWYSRIHVTDEGIDPYTRATSDVYQDLFGEGSFIGKGIYDVDIFSKLLDNRFPENRILSHDLLEGCYTRCGLLSDVQLYEAYPSTYVADVKRRHRWIRGDWQIGAWLWSAVPGPGHRLQNNPLSGLSRWKILDNLRRSLVPLALLLLFISGWTILHAAWFWTLSVIAMVLLPHLVATARNVLVKPEDISLKQHFKDSIESATNNFIQTLFTLVCLPFEAFYTLDAIFRTNWRIFLSHKKLLEWDPSHNSNHYHLKGLPSTYLFMWISPITGFAMLVYVMASSPINLLTSLPIFISWMLSPAIAWWLGLPQAKAESKLSNEQEKYLYTLARKTWSFFEQFVSEGDNWLPPDNFQEHPVERIAHRTSPTNIGLALLANLTAYDFGYATIGELMERTSRTVATLQKLEKYNGHFYNWYDTQSLQPLPPKYVSTVDSGNLAGHLMTLHQGLIGLAEKEIISPRFFKGLRDTWLVLKEKLEKDELSPSFQKELEAACEKDRFTLSELIGWVERITTASSTLLVGLPANPKTEKWFWANKIHAQCVNAGKELNLLIPAELIKPESWVSEHFVFSTDLPSLDSLESQYSQLVADIGKIRRSGNGHADTSLLNNFEETVKKASLQVAKRRLDLELLANNCFGFAHFEYDFLYDKSQHLLSIGYNVEDHRKDSGSYDLLASESRLCTFVGIAQGKLPQESWFALGRQLTNRGGTPILLSWSGSMFEYLMPLLVMPTYENTLLDQTNKAMVQVQIAYGRQRGVPWGISESGYNMVDANLNYQYRTFGVPGLGLKRGLGEDLVIAPYASVLALMIDPEEACQNLLDLSSEGFEGNFGLYEAIDYTPARLPRGQSNVVIRSFMVHHQGMSFLSLAYLLLNRPMQKRFSSEPQFQAAQLLLQEKVPKSVAFYTPSANINDTSVETGETEMRIINTAQTPIPEVQLLSNGRYHVMVTNSGGGYSRWKDISVTRWREDTTCDNWGTFCYIREPENGNFWSIGFQPTLKQSKSYEVVFSQGRAEFRRVDNNIETHTEIVVSPEDDVEMRRVRVKNKSRKQRVIEITSYAEVVLAAAASDVSHPAFSNLFVQTEILRERHAILCTRRPRSLEDPSIWMLHQVNVYGVKVEEVSYETDRLKFIGRRNSTQSPEAMVGTGPLSGSEGSVLDPIVSIRYKIIIEPDATATIDMVIGMGDNKGVCQGMVEKYKDRHLTDRAFELSWTHNQVVLRQINATEADAQLYTRLAGSVIYANPFLRADPAVLVKNHRGQSGLWSYSISGDLPIVLLQIEDPSNIDLVKQLIQAHTYWRLKGLTVDLVIWNEDHGGYRQILQNQLMGLISAGAGSDIADRPGGIFVRVADQISIEDRILFQTVARIIISDSKGTLAYQINKRPAVRTAIPNLPSRTFLYTAPNPVTIPQGLVYFNNLGGFTPDGREYIILTDEQESTPTPWVNVLANRRFGTVISESGQSYTWSENAHEFRLSPWNNDPVGDSGGEGFYIRDEESGEYWSPSSLPATGKSSYLSSHGFGYSHFKHDQAGIYSEMKVWVDIELPVKFVVIKMRNHSGRPRKLSATGYVEWVLGDIRPKSAMHIITEVDPDSGALFATNPYNTEFAGRVCFFHLYEPTRSFTGDRLEFLGRNGGLNQPDAMSRIRLSGRTGAGLDPCAAMQATLDFSDGQEQEIVFILGAGINASEASTMVVQFQKTEAVAASIQRVHDYWRSKLGLIKIETPEPSLDFLVNGWLLYQTLSCRFWARSGFYQSGGAFGFRDQLQDSLAVMHIEPQLVREHILLCASRQFKEGDVQHWWHPPLGRGVRTRCSDDFLWLPYVTCRYVFYSGDKSILDESVHYLEGRLLNQGEESYYDLPGTSGLSVSLYDHCVAAVRHGLSFGANGLPLMGSGDWNDGMDKVGKDGKGESVWLAFFLYKVLVQFTDLAKLRDDQIFSQLCNKVADQLKGDIEKNAWDGAWYRRAYFDNGDPLGSSTNPECKIDSIAQSWSKLSGAAQSDRSAMALASADQYLVRKDLSLIQLLDPPFDKSDLNPGYIKGYVPGVRENGGQYTHAAIWMVMAFAASGKNRRAWELFHMINPIYHGSTAAEIAVYKVEPYVVAADVYAVSSFSGRGGWTWYTGSAGWMYQLILESLLGFRREGNRLFLNPCIPEEWKSWRIRYCYLKSTYLIRVAQSEEVKDISISLDEQPLQDQVIPLLDDGLEHQVLVLIPYSR